MKLYKGNACVWWGSFLSRYLCNNVSAATSSVLLPPASVAFFWAPPPKDPCVVLLSFCHYFEQQFVFWLTPFIFNPVRQNRRLVLNPDSSGFFLNLPCKVHISNNRTYPSFRLLLETFMLINFWAFNLGNLDNFK